MACADVSAEIAAIVVKHRATLSRLIDADPNAVTAGKALHFLNSQPGCVSFAAKFRRLQR